LLKQETGITELEEKVKQILDKHRPALFNKFLKFIEERIDKTKDAS